MYFLKNDAKESFSFFFSIQYYLEIAEVTIYAKYERKLNRSDCNKIAVITIYKKLKW